MACHVRAAAALLPVLWMPCTALALQAPVPTAETTTVPESRQSSPSDPAERGPFVKGTLGVEATGTVLAEAWNLNDTHEWLAGGTLGVWWAYAGGRSLGVEFQAVRIFQDQPRTAFVHSLTPVLRCRILDRDAAAMFIEFGIGVSWSDTTVPPRGTRFNYVSVVSTGVTRRLAPQTHAVASFRWLHLSNAGREGRSRNPDIEALGGFFGVSVGF